MLIRLPFFEKLHFPQVDLRILFFVFFSTGAGWLDRASCTVFIALGLGGRSVSFGDRNASLGEFRFEGSCYPEML